MDKYRLLIADHDERFTNYAVSALKLYPEIEIVSVENNGIDAFQKIRHAKVDVLVFDLLLPGMDGISLLRSTNDLKTPPATICCTRFYSDIAMEAVRSYGASYVLYKPIEAHALYSSILSSTNIQRKMKMIEHTMIVSNADNDQIRLFVRNYIVSLGIPTKLIGCEYLTEAILLAKDDLMLTRNLSRGVYLEISRIMHTTPSCVERSIRNAVSTAYSAHKLPDTFLHCPSNKEFIRYILQNLSI